MKLDMVRYILLVKEFKRKHKSWEEKTMEMSGAFECEGKKISYSITDNYSEIKNCNGVEKISRYINFFDENGDNLGTSIIYGEVEALQNINWKDASECYKEIK